MVTDDVSNYVNHLSLANRLGRAIWGIVWLLFHRLSPAPFHSWRCMLLRLFGAKLARGVHIYPSAQIWAPWHLHMAEHSCLAPHVNCYNVAPVRIGRHATVSQYSYLCTASHSIEDPHFSLITAPITIEDRVWVAADVFVGPGVTIGQGAVVGARSSVFHNVEPWTVIGGTPAKFIKWRILKSNGTDRYYATKKNPNNSHRSNPQ